MCDEWMPRLEYALTVAEFERLPRNPAYRYEYFDGKLVLTPRVRAYHGLLPLAEFADPAPLPAGVVLRPVREDDLAGLGPVFGAAFDGIQPFGSLDEETLKTAARTCLERTRDGHDGPLVGTASFVAEEGGRAVGAILVTLVPEGDPCEWETYSWKEPAPADCVEARRGQPHLTWVFVSPWHKGDGVGTALLGAAVRELQALGFGHLLSTFLAGNESSMLWHWRNGFRLLAYPGSKRRWRQDVSKVATEGR